MPGTTFHGRDAVSCENEHLRVTVIREGGHLAEVFNKQAGVSPLWVPPWQSVEPSLCIGDTYPEFGTGSEARLLAGIMGHNLCLDLFGGPSPAEEAAGYTAHGEASVLPYEVEQAENGIGLRLEMPLAQMRFTRTIRLVGRWVQVRESVESMAAFDRPIGWTQHVTLGPPFLDPEKTEFRASMTRSLVTDEDFGTNAYLRPGEEFTWPMAPAKAGEQIDLRRMHRAPSSGYTAHLVDRAAEDGFFVAFSPEFDLAFGYVWKRSDFPWMGIWEENRSRRQTPWNGRAVTRGMEFGVSLFPESRRKMVERGEVFGVPGFRWLGAGEVQHAEYWISCTTAKEIPEHLVRPA